MPDAVCCGGRKRYSADLLLAERPGAGYTGGAAARRRVGGNGGFQDRRGTSRIGRAGGCRADSYLQRVAEPFPVTFGWILCGIAAVLLLLCASVPGVQSWTQKIGEDSRKAIHAYRYETKNTVLPEGDFTDYQKQNGTRAGLEVTMSNPEALYLRGFTGATLEGDTWSTVDSAVLAQNQALLYWLNENAFHPAAQYASAAAGTDRGTGSVSIQNIGACSAYQYVPFSLRDTGNLPAENLKEDSLPSDGERTYRYSVVTSGGNGIEQTLSRLQTSDDAQVLQYRRAESAYRSFVYRNYLQVPESVTQLLGQYWDETTAGYGSRENLTLPQAQACTLTFLSRCFPEEGTPEDMELPLTAAEKEQIYHITAEELLD